MIITTAYIYYTTFPTPRLQMAAIHPSNRINELKATLRQSLRRTFEAILKGRVYRNFGEMPHYEHPIRDLKDTLGFDNLDPAQVEHLTSIILAIFDNQHYPGQGTMPDIETPIHQTCSILNQALNENINRIVANNPWYNQADN